MLPSAICLRVNRCILEACLLSFYLSLCLLEETPASKLGVDSGEPENDGTKRSHKRIPGVQISYHGVYGYSEHD
jgi:hypothetical protein